MAMRERKNNAVTKWEMTGSMDVTTLGDIYKNTTLNGTSFLDPISDLQTVLWIYFISGSVVIFVGLVFDILSIAVFLMSRALRRTTTGHYMIALMFADTCFLIGELLKWLTFSIDGKHVLGVRFTDRFDTVCRLVHFIRYSAKLVSAWLTVVITLERVLTVSMPLRVGQISTTAKAKAVIFGVISVCVVLCAYPFWTVGVQPWEGISRCLITDGVQYEAWSMVILRVGSLFVPCFVIFVQTIVIIVCLYRAEIARRKMSRVEVKSVQKQLTAMLLAVAISFIVLRLPYTIFWYLNNYFEKLGLDPDTKYGVYFARLITEVIASANYASNFFLFCLCGQAFRKQLRALCRRRKKNKLPCRLSNTQN